MTDKQIIIDGVDVSGCEYYNKDDNTCREVNGNYNTDICEFDKCENSNCCYKQLKPKEQSEAKLVKQLQTICDFINNRPEIFKGIYGSVDKIITEYAERKERECKALALDARVADNHLQHRIEMCDLLREKLKAKEQECNKLYIQLKADEEYHKEEENTLRKIIKNKEERNIELYKENNQLKVSNEKMSKGYSELTEIVSPYIDDFTGYNEKLGGFDIVLCVKELLQQFKHLKTENEKIKESRDYYKRIVDGCPDVCENGFCQIDFYNKKLTKTLTEIKPTLEFYANSKMGEEQPDRTYKIILNGSYITVYDPKPARQALQKISEVENEN